MDYATKEELELISNAVSSTSYDLLSKTSKGPKILKKLNHLHYSSQK